MLIAARIESEKCTIRLSAAFIASMISAHPINTQLTARPLSVGPTEPGPALADKFSKTLLSQVVYFIMFYRSSSLEERMVDHKVALK